MPTCVVSSLLILLDNESSVKLRFGIFSLETYLLALASTRTWEREGCSGYLDACEDET